ncbi:MAG: hypothetical protein K2V38_03855 [Gemmataceae bacterium]|nr:hypothetical protein [Gemmataceae bacterium]
MTFQELAIGDVFKVARKDGLWRKVSPTRAHVLGRRWDTRIDRAFEGKTLEIVEKAPEADIRRMDNTLVLKGGEVTLDYYGSWTVYKCMPGEVYTEFTLTAQSFSGSRARVLTEDAAISFQITLGSKHLNRPGGSIVFAYRGRVYGRATNKEVFGQSKMGGYKVVAPVDGVKRMTIAGVLTIPGEFALYDIIQEHFGPDTTRLPDADVNDDDSVWE